MDPVDLYGNTRRDLRRRISGKRSWEPKNLHQLNHEILNESSLGFSNSQIAEKLGVTSATVSNTVNSSLGKEKLLALRGARDADVIDIGKEISERLPRAIAVYDEILDSDVASLALKKRVADTLLIDLGGYAAPKRFEGRIASAHALTPETVELIKELGKKSAAACGDLVSVNE